MEDNYRLTVDDIYTTLVNNGDIPASNDEAVINMHKDMISVTMEQSKKDLDRLFSPSPRLLSELIRENVKELEDQNDTLSDVEKLKRQVNLHVMYKYQRMTEKIWTQ